MGMPDVTLTEVGTEKFVVKVNGVQVGSPQPTRTLAEAFLLSLSETDRASAIIVPVSDKGELLLG